MGQFMDCEAAVADEDDLTTWQPARQLQCALPGPVRQQFVTTAVSNGVQKGPLGGRCRSIEWCALPCLRRREGVARPEAQAGQKALIRAAAIAAGTASSAIIGVAFKDQFGFWVAVAMCVGPAIAAMAATFPLLRKKS